MRIVWLLLAAVAAAGAFVLGVASQRVVPIGGTSLPVPGAEPGLIALTKCVREHKDLSDLNLEAVRVGPVIRDSSGDRIFALTKDRTLIDCSRNGGFSIGPLSELGPDVKASFAGTSYTQGAAIIVGYGQVAQDVARLDAVLPDGDVVKASIASGLFAFRAEGTDPDVDIALRAYDKLDKLIYEYTPH